MDQQTNPPTEQNIQQPTAPAGVPSQLPDTPPPPVQDQNLQSAAVVTDSHKKRKLLLGTGILFFIVLLICLILYATGSLNRAKQLSPQPSIMMQKPTVPVQPEKSQEELEAESVDTGDPTTDINEIENEASSL